jgi:adenylate cyclase
VAAATAAVRLRRELAPVLDPRGLRVGLALGSGEVVAGEIGSTERCEFTVIGDAVNRTARLEGMNGPLGTTCLMTAEVAAALPPAFRRADRGAHPLKGLNAPVPVVELLD